MAFRTLLITLGSGEKLHRAFHVIKMDVYAFISISDSGDKGSRQEARTTVDHRGDVNPRWNCRIQFNVDEAALQANRLTLDFKLVCKRLLSEEDIGQLSVPVKELLDYPAAAAGEDHSVTYDVRNPGGKSKGGKLTFSCKFGEKTAPAPPPEERKDPGMAQKAIGPGFESGKKSRNAVASWGVKKKKKKEEEEEQDEVGALFLNGKNKQEPEPGTGPEPKLLWPNLDRPRIKTDRPIPAKTPSPSISAPRADNR